MIRLAVRVRGEDTGGVVLAELLELSPAGVEERELADGVEYVLYGPAGELPALPALETAVGDVLVEVTSEEIADDWGERWKRWHQPLELNGLRVRPPWEDAAADGIDLVIDPAQAFGTGAHATTRLCLELLLELDAGRLLRRLGLRERRARDRGRPAGLRSRHRRGLRPAGGDRDARQRARQRDHPRRRPRSTSGRRRGLPETRSARTCSPRCCARSLRVSSGAPPT